MSRSRKKIIGYCDSNKFAKTYANRVVRRKTKVVKQDIDEDWFEQVPPCGKYKHFFCQYNIRDWSWFFHSKQEFERFVAKYPNHFKRHKYTMK